MSSEQSTPVRRMRPVGPPLSAGAAAFVLVVCCAGFGAWAPGISDKAIAPEDPRPPQVASAQDRVLGAVAGGAMGLILSAALVWYPSAQWRSHARTLADRARRCAGPDREARFDELLIFTKGHPMEPLARALREALITTNKERIEAGSLRRALDSAAELRARQMTASLSKMAQTDELTGLLNRRGFDESLEQAMASMRGVRKPLSLAAIDMDRLKQLNDTLGHEKGDIALRAAGEVIAACSRADDRGARTGGDEFWIIMPGSDELASKHACERLRTLFAQHPSSKGFGERWPGLSIGIATLKAEDDAESFKCRADRALYVSKNGGRGRVTLASDLARARAAKPAA